MLCGLIGERLSHSYSAIIHNDIGKYKYELFSLPESELELFLQRRDFSGINVTIPYKKAVIPYCDRLDSTAHRIGSVNTIVKDSRGELCGYNTDYFGFLTMCNSAGIDFEGKKVLILGSGGTSATVYTAASDMGAREIIIVSRTGKENYNNLSRHWDSDVIVNTTPVGMYPNNGDSLIDLKDFSNCSGVVDVIYNPLRTRLIESAQELGIPCTGGLTMLVAQAYYAAKLFTKGLPDITFDESNDREQIESLRKLLLRRICNIVLVGMPGSGKTTIGWKVAELLKRDFIDTDALIAERAGMAIPDIFSQYGEEHFRSIESDTIAECTKLSGKVVATGGGAVLSEENRKNISQNGLVIQISRCIEDLEGDGRPLSKDLDTLRQMVQERQPLYDACSMFTIHNSRSVEEAANKIVEVYYAYSGD